MTNGAPGLGVFQGGSHVLQIFFGATKSMAKQRNARIASSNEGVLRPGEKWRHGRLEQRGRGRVD